MPSSLDKLKKIISLEKKRDFDNKAVLGGFQKVLGYWLEEAQKEAISDRMIQSLVTLINRYEQADHDSRSKIIDTIHLLIENKDIPETYPVLDKKTSPTSDEITEDNQRQRQTTAKKITYTDILHSPVTNVAGVGPSMAKKLSGLNITTINDLIYFFPRRYDDFSNLLPINRLEFGQEVTAIGTVKSIATRPTRNPKLSLTEAILTDGTGYIRLSWFNKSYLENVLRPEMQIVVSGKVENYLGRLTINNPEWEDLAKEQLHTNRIVPIYPLVANLKQRSLRNLMFKTITFWAPRLDDYIPESILQSTNMMSLSDAVYQIHFPESIELLKQARRRIGFNEIFLLQLGALQTKQLWQNGKAQRFQVSDGWLSEQIEKFPYQLTSAQVRSIEDIRADLDSGQPMNRLLQGDVGSGKTAVAATASAIILNKDAQVAILAPTSILAEQHYKTFLSFLSKSTERPIFEMLDSGSIRLLVGGTPADERDEILKGLQNENVKLVIGTHALLEEPVKFSNLQLAIIDEQHRFGVKQRAKLRAKGENPHLLVMTATPIPRSLALTIYGDLDLSVIDQMPPGRQHIETHALFPIERERAYALIHSQIQTDHQAFIIYPFVESEDGQETRSAVTEFERLKAEIFPKYRLGLVHGRMNQEEKELVMKNFRDRNVEILVATSVIEVGIDIPNATVMLIEGANRFGLAQLHQLRGRVGRGQAQSYCLLIPETEDAVENERLIAMSATNDGFELAEQDLAQRGPGEFFGIRQSGYSNLKIASLTNIKLIEQARFYAQKVFDSDPNLDLPQHHGIKALLQVHWEAGQGDIS